MTLKKREGSDKWYMFFQIDGVIVRESTKTADKRLAEQIYAKRKGELFSEVVVRGRKRCGVKGVTCHVMRHTYACNLLQAGVRIDDVQKLLGHKNLETTMRYLHLVPGAAGVQAKEIMDAQAAQRDAESAAQAVPATQALRLVA
jgi:integrase